MATAGATSAELIMSTSSAVAKAGLPLVLLSSIFVGLMVYLVWLAIAEVPDRDPSAEDVAGRFENVDTNANEEMSCDARIGGSKEDGIEDDVIGGKSVDDDGVKEDHIKPDSFDNSEGANISAADAVRTMSSHFDDVCTTGSGANDMISNIFSGEIQDTDTIDAFAATATTSNTPPVSDTTHAELKNDDASDFGIVDTGSPNTDTTNTNARDSDSTDASATENEVKGAGISTSTFDVPCIAPTASRLLDLPPELRNPIYELVFALTSKTAPGGEVDLRVAVAYRPEPSLLAVCRRTREEASGLYTSALRDFWKAHKVVLRISDETLFSPSLMDQLLGQCQGIPSPGLQSLVLHIGTPPKSNPLRTHGIKIRISRDAASEKHDSDNEMAPFEASVWTHLWRVNMLPLLSHIAAQNGLGSYTQMDKEGTENLGWSLRAGACVLALCTVNARIQARLWGPLRFTVSWMIHLVVWARDSGQDCCARDRGQDIRSHTRHERGHGCVMGGTQLELKIERMEGQGACANCFIVKLRSCQIAELRDSNMDKR